MNRRQFISSSMVMTAVGLTGCDPATSELTLLVGTYTNTDSKGIYTYRMDTHTGQCAILSVTEVANPSFLAITPDHRNVYAVTEQLENAAVSSFTFDISEGKLTLTGSQPSNGQDPCFVTWLGNEITATNYTSGSMAIFPIDDDGRMQECRLLEFHESGPDTLRQKTSHIHSSQLSPDGEFLFVTDLGGDFIYRYPVKNGKVSELTPFKIKVPAGCGPRHFTFSKDGRYMYVITELGGTILAYAYEKGSLTQIQEIKADPNEAGGSADIHFSPDGRFLYASHRLKGDGISIFRQDSATGMLTAAGYQPTAIHPRNFAITPDGSFVLVACRDSDVIQVYKRDRTSGLLSDTHNDIKVPCPVCVLTVQ